MTHRFLYGIPKSLRTYGNSSPRFIVNTHRYPHHLATISSIKPVHDNNNKDYIHTLQKHDHNRYSNACHIRGGPSRGVPLVLLHHRLNLSSSHYSRILVAAIHTDNRKCKDESKVEKTVELLKESKVDEPSVSAKAKDAPVTEVEVKKSLGQRFWAEVMHYYHGFRLLAVDVKICVKLLWAVLNGKNLTRRERNLLVRTTADLFRLVPFAVFVIVPFMEFLLPVAIKLFPGMLPSTFSIASKEQEKIRKRLKVKLDMAKFLQDTIEETAVHNTDKTLKKLGQEFAQFLHKVRTSGVASSNEDIIKFSKLFEDDMTLDNLNQGQLKALCRVLEIQPIGTTNFLRFQLRLKLRQLKADDKMIRKEGIDSLAIWELQTACRARGMRSLGVSETRLKYQLQQWLDLHLNEQIPPSLLLLSRTFYLPKTLSTEEKLQATISSLPEETSQTVSIKVAELSGEKVDNKAKRDLLKKEEEAIEREEEEAKKEEEEEQLREAEKKAEEIPVAAESVTEKVEVIRVTETLKDEAPVVGSKPEEELVVEEHKISSRDLEDLELAVESIDEEKSIELELKELKEDVTEYQEDIQEMKDVIVQTGRDLRDVTESKAAMRLSKKVYKMIGQMDAFISDLQKEKSIILENIEVKEVKMKRSPEYQKSEKKQEVMDWISEEKDNVISINEMVLALRRIQKVPNDTKIQKILEVLDEDHDGQIEVDTVMKVIELLGRENVKLDASQMGQIMELLRNESEIEEEAKLDKSSAAKEQTPLNPGGSGGESGGSEKTQAKDSK